MNWTTSRCEISLHIFAGVNTRQRIVSGSRHIRQELADIAKIPDLGRYWLGQLVSQVGSGATLFVLMAMVYIETESLVLFALLFAIDNLPGLVLAPISGTLVDRYDRRLLHIIGDGGVALVTLAAIVLWSTDNLTVVTIYTLVLASASFEVIQSAASEAMYQELIPKEKLVRVGAVLGPFDEIVEVIAPAIGVLVLALSSAGYVFMLDLVTFMVALWTLFTLKNPQAFRRHLSEANTTEDDDGDEQGSVQFFFDGVTHLRKSRGLKFIFSYEVLNDFLSSMVLLMAAAAALELGGEAILASVQGAAGVGAILGMALIALFGLRRGQIIKANVVVPGFIIGACLLFVPLTSSAIALTIGAFVFMLLSAPLDAALNATYLAAVPKKLIGRISAVFEVATGLANLFLLLVVVQLIDKLLVPALARNSLELGWFGSIGGTDAKLDALIITIGIAGVGMLVLNSWALCTQSRTSADELAREIETRPAFAAPESNTQPV